MSKEADVIAEFDHRLRSVIENQHQFGNLEFTGVQREPYIESAGGFADLILEVDNAPFLVIEAKREPAQNPDRSIDPYSQEVISQAGTYAWHVGAEYFATYNRRRLVLFRTLEQGTNLLDRRTLAYEISNLEAFIPEFLNDLAGLEADLIDWDPHQEAFIKRLASFHEILDESFSEVLIDRLEDDTFLSRYEDWIVDQGWGDRYEDNPSSVHETFTSQAAYLLLNKLVFYKLLENAEAYSDVPDIDMEQLVEADTRREIFDELMDRVDFEAVYEQDPIFDSLRLTQRARREVSSLLADLEEYNLNQFDHDVIGQIYQEIIPPDERHALGQYYTPKEIVDLIIRMTVESPEDYVLDPGCGSGGFLVGAYNRIRTLSEDKGHEEVLDQIFGVDINRFPAHLSAINLALRDLSTETHDTHVVVEDFFNIIESQGRVVAAPRASIEDDEQPGEDDEYDVEIPSTIDVAVANPPYIRNENIGDPDRARDHLDNLDLDLSERSDIYCYFFTHAFEFLQRGSESQRPGRMGFLTSNRWLMVGYGEDLQEFFLDNLKIKSVIDFHTQQFEVPLISTTVTILERCDDEEDREQNITNFLRLKRDLTPSEIIEILDEGQEPGTLQDDEGGRFRRVTFRQGALRDIERWDRYLYAPGVYWDFLDNDAICELGDVADVRFGTKTGNNSYFYFESEQEYESLGLDDQFVTPILKHIAQTEFVKLSETDPTWYVLDLHQTVEEILDNTENTIMQQRTSEEVVLDEFKNRGWDNLLQYLDFGVEQGVDEGQSVQNIGRAWFDVGELPRPELILPKEYWRDSRVLYNEANIPLDQRNYEVNVTNTEVDPLVLLGIMNSSLFTLVREIEGREEQGQAMNRNELTVGEAAGLHIPDPRRFSQSESEAIRGIMERWMSQERNVAATGEEVNGWEDPDDIESSIDELQENLDRAVLAAIGMEVELELIQNAVAELLNTRIEGGGESTSVLVSVDEEAEEGGREIEIPGAKRIGSGDEQTGLDAF